MLEQSEQKKTNCGETNTAVSQIYPNSSFRGSAQTALPFCNLHFQILVLLELQKNVFGLFRFC